MASVRRTALSLATAVRRRLGAPGQLHPLARALLDRRGIGGMGDDDIAAEREGNALGGASVAGGPQTSGRDRVRRADLACKGVERLSQRSGAGFGFALLKSAHIGKTKTREMSQITAASASYSRR